MRACCACASMRQPRARNRPEKGCWPQAPPGSFEPMATSPCLPAPLNHPSSRASAKLPGMHSCCSVSLACACAIESPWHARTCLCSSSFETTCLRCGLNDESSPGVCCFHPALLPDPGPLRHTPECVVWWILRRTWLWGAGGGYGGLWRALGGCGGLWGARGG